MKRLDERWHSSNFGKLPMHRSDALQFNLSVLALECGGLLLNYICRYSNDKAEEAKYGLTI